MTQRAITVRGTQHYDATSALASGQLKPGASLKLVPRPDNAYDRTAVEVRLSEGAMLGHVPREFSSEFFAHAKAGKIKNARVLSIQKAKRGVNLVIEAQLDELPVQRSLTPPPIEAESPEKRRPPSSGSSAPLQDGTSWLVWVIGVFLLVWFLVS